jgi:glycosyltransferase involved in cell wall biosynthesis
MSIRPYEEKNEYLQEINVLIRYVIKMKIMFIFDRVAHYHLPLFIKLDSLLTANNHQLCLLSGEPKPAKGGRVGLSHNVVNNETKYTFTEYNILSYIIRHQKNIIGKIINYKPDIIVVPSHVGNVTNWNIMRLKKKFNFKLYAWQCGYEYHENRVKRMVLKYFLRKFDHHLAYHTNAKRYVMKYGVDPKHITVMFNTIDENSVKNMDKDEARKKIIKRYPELKNKNIVLFVGAILREKRIDLLLSAFKVMKRKDVALLIVGDGPYMNSLMNQCDGNPNIVFTGRVIKGVDLYFNCADIFVLPGTGGLAINEAMAHGLPVISGYADGSADDLVVHGENGYRIKDGSSIEIAKYLSMLLDNEDLRTQFGKESSLIIKNKYSFDKFVNKIYESFL